ncbi:unnamed protein product [Allacma fusca]|uniref:Heat shock protein 70 n=1 Tax=Allacma fusca TaxID=39272 RepID=A0A8J2LLP7_9HEXA|nr:unnamed protein product [Allacma fusca]
MENRLKVKLSNRNIFYCNSSNNDLMPSEILPLHRESFVGVDDTNLESMFAYQIDSTDLAFVVAMRVGPDFNAFATAFVQLPAVTDAKEFEDFMDPNQWTKYFYRKYATAKEGQAKQWLNVEIANDDQIVTHTFMPINPRLKVKFDDEHIQDDIKLWPFDVIDDEGQLKVKAEGKALLPEDISKELLAYLKSTAEERLGFKITQAVVTVPAYFTPHQRQLTIQACNNAGLKVLQLMTEPTAAAVAYNLHRGDDTDKNALIYDLGGGTFDVAVLSMTKNLIRIRSLGGDTRLGGEDFDRILVDYCILQFEKLHGQNLADGKHSGNAQVKFKVSKRLRRIKKECEKQKCFLSQAKSVTICIDAIFGELDMSIMIKRETFEELIQEYLDRSIKVMEVAIADSGVSKEDIQDIVLIGGSSRIPKVEEMLGEYFQKPLYKAVNADEAVAAGAAIQAYYAQQCDFTGIAIEQPNKKHSRPFDESPTSSTPFEMSSPTSDSPDFSTWSSSKSLGSVVVSRRSESPSRSNKSNIRRLSGPLTTNESKTGTTITLGVYIDEEKVTALELKDGKVTVHSKPILDPYDNPPLIAIRERFYTGKEAEKFSGGENFYRILDLITRPTNKICQLTDSRSSDFGILFEEELIAAFLRDLMHKLKRAKGTNIGAVVLALPFVPTCAQRERIKIAAVLAKIPNTHLYSCPILTTISYASLRKSMELQTNFETITFLVVHYGKRFLTSTLIAYSPQLMRIKNYFSSYCLEEDESREFVEAHEKITDSKFSGPSEALSTIHQKILSSSCPEEEITSVDFGFLISCHDSKPIDNLVSKFIKKTVYTFDDLSGPLAGASILATKAFNLGETPIFDAVPGNLQCSVKLDKNIQTVFDERNESILPYPGEVFHQIISLGERSRGAVISLKEVLPHRTSEICTYRLSTPFSNNNQSSIPVTCHVDEDGLLYLFVEETEVNDIEFFRTDKLNSDVEKISNRIDSFSRFYKSLDKRGWKGYTLKGTISRANIFNSKN